MPLDSTLRHQLRSEVAVVSADPLTLVAMRWITAQAGLTNDIYTGAEHLPEICAHTIVLLDVPGDRAIAETDVQRSKHAGRKLLAVLGGWTAEREKRLHQLGVNDVIWRGMSTAGMISTLRTWVAPPVAMSNALCVGDAFAALTPRQQDVARLLMRGVGNKRIAHALGMAEGTVKVHLSTIYDRLGARNRVEAVMRLSAATSPVGM